MALISPKTKTLQEKLTQLRQQEEEGRAKDLAAKFNLPYLDLSIISIETEGFGLLPEEKAKKGQLAIIQKRGQQLGIAVQNPENVFAKEILAELKKAGYQIKLFIVSSHSLEKAWQTYKEITLPAKEISGQVEIATDFLQQLQKEIKNLEELKKKIQTLPAGQVSGLVEILLAGALQTSASDIHLETEENKVNLRYRIDGFLQDVVFLSPKIYHFVLNRIKLLAGLKLNIHDLAQDGRFTISVDKTDIEVRVSCLPSAYGENIVMRVLNPQMIGLELEDLGLRPDLLKIIQKEIQKPNGLIITTGPTGSGKTTTLYALLKRVNKPGIKIITIEDPIEYHLAGITQTQVDEEGGYGFANGLLAILRQDPDVVLIGEIRDKETAQTAIQASLTGHLVFSTLHTNDAAGAIPRFIELGAKAPILASGLNLVLAQRLVRKVCPKCKEAFQPSVHQLSQIKKALQGLPSQVKYPVLDKKLKIYQAQGCSDCHRTGYQGRIGLFEMICIDEPMEKLISSSPSHAQVLQITQERGMTFMRQDGLLKALEGITTLEEVKRVTKE